MDGRFKFVFLIAVLFMTSLPLMGILRGTNPPPETPEENIETSQEGLADYMTPIGLEAEVVKQEMVLVPAGEFFRGTNEGGYNERPLGLLYLEPFWIDKYEVTNAHYSEFVEATGHRQPGPPSRYARKLAHLRGANQPVAYVSWADASAYCEWKGKRLPTESEWEKAIRGTDGRTWPWGEDLTDYPANFGGSQDGFEYTAPVGSFPKDRSIFGVFDGAGNAMEWADNWYIEDLYKVSTVKKNKRAQRDGTRTYKTLRGGGYTSRGIDLRITNRMFMVPDFRDETIGFRCAKSDAAGVNEEVVAKSHDTQPQRKSK